MSRQDRLRTSRSRSLRFPLTLGWMAFTFAIASFAILKPSTTAADLILLPNPLIEWLDTNFNFRTFVMAFGICVVPAIVFSSTRWNGQRRGWLMLSLSILLGLECAQLWIPTRGFSWEDVGYTIGGVFAAEVLAMLLCRAGRVTAC